LEHAIDGTLEPREGYVRDACNFESQRDWLFLLNAPKR
jgi:hypothetical protein